MSWSLPRVYFRPHRDRSSIILRVSRCHADAHRYSEAVVADRERLGCHLAAQPLGSLERARHVDLGKRRGEFLASHAAEDVALSHAAAEPLGHDAQHAVADRMAVPIVDQLEIVGIDHHHRQRPVVAQRPGKLAIQRQQKLASVRKLREIVDRRQFAQLVGRVHQFRDVGISQHASAVRQGDALELQRAAVGQPQLHRRLAAGANLGDALADIVVHCRGRDFQDAGLLAVRHEVGKIVGRTGRRWRQAPYSVVGLIDEPRLQVAIQQKDAIADFVQR